MSRICLLCGENETQEATDNKVCDTCYKNAADHLESNAELYAVADDMLEACQTAVYALNQIPNTKLRPEVRNHRNTYSVCSMLDALIAKAKGRT
jgi:hypothetical protein